MTGCFTGIESTPKITAKDVKRQNIPVKAENSYLADVVPNPLTQWNKGKRFHVTDDKFKLLLLPSALGPQSLKGSDISFDSWKEVTDITGKRIAELTFITDSGTNLTYRSQLSAEDLTASGHTEIPFLIDLDIIDRLNERLAGNSYFIITSAWYDAEMKSLTGQKFIPVTIDTVTPGNTFYTAVLNVSDRSGRQFKLYMSIDSDNKALRHFGSLFSLSDPRKAYPDIADDIWDRIVNGKVKAGMTKEECRLALGSPASIDRRIGYSSVREIWSYENGIFLIFEDNVLQTFRQ